MKAWLDAWSIALATLPPSDATRRLAGLRSSLDYLDPRFFGHRCREVWTMYQDLGDTGEGRAAVALSTIIGAHVKGWIS